VSIGSLNKVSSNPQVARDGGVISSASVEWKEEAERRTKSEDTVGGGSSLVKGSRKLVLKPELVLL
jgi:hypothetical protein